MNKTIALDAFGGDFAPKAAIKGAILALGKMDHKIILVGNEEKIQEELSNYSFDKNRIEIAHASQVIGVDDVPTLAIRQKKDSSLLVGLRLLKEEKAQAFISAGSTGALLAGATIHVGRIEGVIRPVLGATIPNLKGLTLLVDSGANMDSEPRFLVQYALLGSLYMEHVLHIDNPRVGLLNVGVEKEKGNQLVKATYPLLEDLKDINFIGNVEARDVPLGACDVLVSDGFAGNILLKNTEGMAKMLMKMVKNELMSSTISKIGAFLSKGAYKNLAKTSDYREIGGAPFLGLKGLVVKAHGTSDEIAFCSSILQSGAFIENDIISKVETAIAHTI